LFPLQSLWIFGPDGAHQSASPISPLSRDIVAAWDGICVLGNRADGGGKGGSEKAGAPFLTLMSLRGQPLWTNTLDHSIYADVRLHKAVYAEDSLIIAADATPDNQKSDVGLLFRMYSDGAELWAKILHPELGGSCSFVDLCVSDDGVIGVICCETVFDEEFGEPIDRICDVVGLSLEGEILWQYRLSGGREADWILPVESGFLCVSRGLDLYNCPFLGDGWVLLLDGNGKEIAAAGTPNIGGGRFEICGASKTMDGKVLLYGSVLESPGAPDKPFCAALDFPEAYGLAPDASAATAGKAPSN